MKAIQGMTIEEIIAELERIATLLANRFALCAPVATRGMKVPSGAKAQFLDDGTTYLGTQLETGMGGDRCFGVVANMEFILICTYEKDGVNPELVLYKRR